MNNFTGPLTVTQLDAWREWRIDRALVYETAGGQIAVPAGFVTDGASIPQFLWSVLPTWARYSRAAVLHDHLYSLLRAGAPHPLAPARGAADAIFFEAMVACGVNSTVRWLLWAAVRVFGKASSI